MPFLKHIGKHGDRKVVVLWRKTPGEDHMCLLIYPEVLQAAWHDTIMKVLEGAPAQQAENFADVLHRNTLPDGRLILETLHRERIIKKVRCADIIMTPLPNATIRLDELNGMLDKMAQGEEAYKQMAESDAARGLVDPKVKRRHEAEYKEAQTAQPFVAAEGAALTDRDIAANNLAQAEQMEREAKAMIAEAARMKKEAERLFPAVTVAKGQTAAAAEAKPKSRAKKTAEPVTEAVAEAKPRRSRKKAADAAG